MGPQILYVFNRLEELAANPLLDPFIATEIRSAVSWHFVYSKSGTSVAAGKVLDAIPTSLHYEVSRAIADSWGRTFETSENPGRNEAALAEWRSKLTNRILEVYGKNFSSLIQMLDERLSTLSQAQTQNPAGVDIGPFLATLLETSPLLAVILGEYILANPKSLLANWFNVVVVVNVQTGSELCFTADAIRHSTRG